MSAKALKLKKHNYTATERFLPYRSHVPVSAGLSLLSGSYFTNRLRDLCLSERLTIHYSSLVRQQVRPLPNGNLRGKQGPHSRIRGELHKAPKAVRTDDANDFEIYFRSMTI
jgi:hypothetical protein